jgi:2-phosphoglycerate kinase
MIFWDKDSNLLATGLPLKAISKLLASNSSDSEIQQSLKKLGTKYLTRYLIVKEYRILVEKGTQKLPIIPIIVGIPGVGKTTSIYDTWKFFGEYNLENLIQGFKVQADTMNSIVQKMIADRGLRDGESMIMEYLHFLPSQFNSDLLKHPSIMPIILQITEKDLYKERIKLRTKYSHLRSSGERLISEVDKYLQIQEYLCSEASKNAIEIVNVNDFVEGYETILDFVIGRIKKLNELKDYTDRIKLIDEIKDERKT